MLEAERREVMAVLLHPVDETATNDGTDFDQLNDQSSCLPGDEVYDGIELRGWWRNCAIPLEARACIKNCESGRYHQRGWASGNPHLSTLS